MMSIWAMMMVYVSVYMCECMSNRRSNCVRVYLCVCKSIRNYTFTLNVLLWLWYIWLKCRLFAFLLLLFNVFSFSFVSRVCIFFSFSCVFVWVCRHLNALHLRCAHLTNTKIRIYSIWDRRTLCLWMAMVWVSEWMCMWLCWFRFDDFPLKSEEKISRLLCEFARTQFTRLPWINFIFLNLNHAPMQTDSC